MKKPLRITPPAIWGKLPSGGDFVRHRTTAVEIDAWRYWLEQQTWIGTDAAVTEVEPKHQGARARPDWSEMQPAFGQAGEAVHHLPWSFVLPPGTLPFAACHWVVGALAASGDSVGRSYPLVIYQTANTAWLERCLDPPQGWLFWLGQLMARHISGQSAAPGGGLGEQLDRLWNWHRLGWRSWFGTAPVQADETACRDLIGVSKQEAEADPIQGVKYLPWAEWPRQLWDDPPRARGWFWQQDRKGGFLDARCV